MRMVCLSPNKQSRNVPGRCRICAASFVSYATIPFEEEEMKYMLLIYQGTTPTPNDPEAWATLAQEEQGQVFADYQALNETAGVTPGVQMQSPDTATTVVVKDGDTLTTDGPFAETKEALGGYLFFEADDLDAAIAVASKIP